MTHRTPVLRALAALKRAHIGFPGMINSLQPKLRVPAVLLGEAVIILFFALLAWYNTQPYPWNFAYPMNIGGRPYNSWPAFIVPTFECTILLAAISGVVGMPRVVGCPVEVICSGASLSAPSGRPVSVNYATANGTAIAPAGHGAMSPTKSTPSACFMSQWMILAFLASNGAKISRSI